MILTRRKAIISGLAAMAEYRLLGQSVSTGHHRMPPTSGSSCVANGAWAMNEGSGLTLHDTSGNSNTATIDTGASVVWTANAIKSGVTSPVWAGGTGFALATSTTLTNFDGSTPFAVAAWINPTVIGDQTLFGTLDAIAGTYKGWELHIQAGDDAISFLLISDFPGSDYLYLQSSPALTVGTLNYVVATYDGSKTAAGVAIYLNGTALTTNSVGSPTLTGSAANGLPVRFASRSDGTFGYSGPMAYAEVYPCLPPTTFWAANYAAGPGIY